MLYEETKCKPTIILDRMKWNSKPPFPQISPTFDLFEHTCIFATARTIGFSGLFLRRV